eukprot:scaffold9412_cov263-Amphora_coffeaeformis.AAC.4
MLPAPNNWKNIPMPSYGMVPLAVDSPERTHTVHAVSTGPDKWGLLLFRLLLPYHTVQYSHNKTLWYGVVDSQNNVW